MGEPSETAKGRDTRHGPVDGSLRLTFREKAAFLARLLREGEHLALLLVKTAVFLVKCRTCRSVSSKDSSVSSKNSEL